ncbi:MAG: ferrous iron transport protein B [Desulfovibrio sp.]|jgi:ferrous iron transport protein B|nr:ferrous iron transport protein B [Desulfovibrio sp.]
MTAQAQPGAPGGHVLIAIAGNPNSGKTTAFNRYTGARRHVGNYPGVTVEKKSGTAHLDGRDIILMDLPGMYSMSAYSPEETAARQALAEERPGAIIDVVNAGVLERNLYLTVQFLEMGLPVVICLNMMDEARAQGLTVNVQLLEELTGAKAVPAVARNGEGLEETLRAAVEVAEKSGGRITPLEISYGPDLDAALAEMVPVIMETGLFADTYPPRWVAMKFLECDRDMLRSAQTAAPEVAARLQATADKTLAHLRNTVGVDAEAVAADYRYGWIRSILRRGVCIEDEQKQRIDLSDRIDTVLTHRIAGPLFLLAVLYGMYFLTIEVGAYPLALVQHAFDLLQTAADGLIPDGPLKSLVISGIIAGVGGVIGFVPLIVIMFMLIAILEDSGYMARAAYMMDRIFRIFGLHGASIMPFIIAGGIAGGCAVPGVMATRTLRSPRERLATMLTLPFMTCGAKIPVFLLFITVFFEGDKTLAMFLFTLAGWGVAMLAALFMRSTIIRGDASPFVMELPPYRWPTAAGVLIHTWERAWQYVKKAGTVILAISILIWAGMTYPGLSDTEEAAYEAQKSALEERLAALPAGGTHVKDGAWPDRFDRRDPAADASAADGKGGKAPASKSTMPEDARAPADKTAPADGNGGTEATARERIEQQLADMENARAAEALRASYAGRVGIALEGVTAPAGFDWRVNIALIGGIAAKEVVISTLGTAYSLGEVDDENTSGLEQYIREDKSWTKPKVMAFLLFTLLYSPCFVTLTVIRQEAGGWRWFFFSLFFNLALAYCVAVAAFQFPGRLM